MADARRFYSTPDIAMFIDQVQSRRYLSVSLGSGYRAHPLDKTTNDRFYSMRDPDIFNRLTQTQYNNYSVIEDADLVEVQGDFGTVISTSDRGWKLTIPGDEKVLASSRTFDDTIYFVTFEPEVSSTDPCTAGQSVNRLYAVNVENGDAVVALEAPVPETPEDADAARITELQQGGIAPVPIFLFPSDWGQTCEGGECPKPKPVGCVGVECFDPEFENRPVRTLWIQDGVE
jgi:type IV pilus assembly protein PilY1